MPLLQLSHVRLTVIVGILLAFSVINSFGGVALYLNFSSSYLDAAFKDETTPLFAAASPSSYPYLTIILLITNLPFLLAGMLMLLRVNLLVPRDDVFYTPLIGLSNGIFIVSTLLIIANIYAELYAPSQLIFVSFMRLYWLLSYLFILLLGISLAVSGWYAVSRRVFHPLGWVSVTMGILAVLVNLPAPNYELPSFRFTLGLIPVSIDAVIWTSFLWVVWRTNSANRG